MFDQVASNKLKSALLVTGFVLFVLLVGYVFGEVTDWGPAGLTCALLFAFVTAFGSYWYSDRIVLGLSRARPVSKETEPYIVNTVEGLAIAAGLPAPACYIIDESAPNAFATGRDPQHAAIAVTAGLVQKMDRLQLEGVIAHELAHIQNFDTRLQTLTAVLAGSVALLSEWMLRSVLWRGLGGRDRSSAEPVFMVLGLALAILAPLAAVAVQMAISRKREYLADAGAAVLTRYPDGLAGALRKIASDPTPLRVANRATEPLFIYNPLQDRRRGIDGLFDTHPPIEERIRRLEAM